MLGWKLSGPVRPLKDLTEDRSQTLNAKKQVHSTMISRVLNDDHLEILAHGKLRRCSKPPLPRYVDSGKLDRTI